MTYILERYIRRMLLRDGFPGQRLRVLPQPLTHSALQLPITERLLVTDAGHFPHAAAHGRSRRNGAAEAIVIVCVDGVGWLEVEDQPRVRVEPGKAIVVPPNLRHRYWADAVDPWTIWWLHATGIDVPELLEVILGEERDPLVVLRDAFSAVEMIDSAVTALEQDETNAMLYLAAGAAWRLLALLASERLRGRPSSNDRIEAIQEHLRTHLTANLSVVDLARQAGLSPSHFSALFKAAAGISVTEYVKRLRCSRARELLITTDGAISDVAEAVGYADAYYFSRQFRSVTGVSPREFRKRSRRDALGSAGD